MLERRQKAVKTSKAVIPAQAGIHVTQLNMDPRKSRG
jgi:hypothetical protein